MITALKLVIIILSTFTAISLACAVTIGRRRDAPADPFAEPFGEIPGFTAEQLARLAPKVTTTDPLRRSFAPGRQRLTPGDRLQFGAGVRMRAVDLIRSDSAGLALRTDADGGRPAFRSRLASIGIFRHQEQRP